MTASERQPLVVTRYRFADFVLSPRRRVLIRAGREVPLIPRYFDLLVLLVARRHEAVHRRDIFDGVWADVIVSDSALSQAVRTLRRTLGDDSREPRFIRTVARHGYRFVHDEVIEEPDDTAPVSAAMDTPRSDDPDDLERLLRRLTGPDLTDDERREAAEVLHDRDMAEVLARLGTRPGHAAARAVLRDVRWDVPAAGGVPVLASPAPVAMTGALLRLRLQRAARLVAGRWAGAAVGAGVAGLLAGVGGGLVLAAAPGSAAPLALAPVLGAIGGAAGACGGAGVGAGLAVAEASTRSRRSLALVVAAGLGGGSVGLLVQWLSRWTLTTMFGLDLDIGGGLEGVVLGAAAGVGYALATRHTGGQMAAPRGPRRVRAALVTALICGLAGTSLTLAGRPLVGGTIHAIADAADGSSATLTPLGRLVGEPDFGPVSRALLAWAEGACFGLGLAYGLMRRPLTVISPNAHTRVKT